jgi:hypothetical protein
MIPTMMADLALARILRTPAYQKERMKKSSQATRQATSSLTHGKPACFGKFKVPTGARDKLKRLAGYEHDDVPASVYILDGPAESLHAPTRSVHANTDPPPPP